MAIAPVVTEGFGSFGSIALVVTEGFGIGEAQELVVDPGLTLRNVSVRVRSLTLIGDRIRELSRS